MRGPTLLDDARLVQAEAAEQHPWVAGLPITGVAWATVELDRAARELAALAGLGCGAWRSGPRDELLGASVRHCPEGHRRPEVVLLEPDTEGRLAAFLARFGEGVGAVYLGDGHDLRDTGRARELGPRGLGPLGPARLLLGRPTWGPHIVILDPEAAA